MYVQDLIKFTNEVSPSQKLPDIVIVTDLERLLSEKDIQNETDERKFALKLARILAILKDFCSFCSKKKDGNAVYFVAFAHFNPNREKFLTSKFSFWFREVWKLFNDKIECKSSTRDVAIKFFLKDDQYFLDSYIVDSL